MGESVCNSCGFVAPERLIDPGYRNLIDESGKQRSGKDSPFGKSSWISTQDKDFSGNTLSPEMKLIFKRLRLWDNRSSSREGKDRNLNYSIPLIKKWCANLGLKEEHMLRAATIYAKLIHANLIKGRTMDGMAAAAIYASCRIDQIPRTAKQVAEVCGVKEKELSLTYRVIHKALDLTPPTPKIDDLLPALGSKLNVPEHLIREGMEIIMLAKERGLSGGRMPMAIVSAALYIVIKESHLKILHSELAVAAGVSQVTIRNNAKVLMVMVQKVKSEQAKKDLGNLMHDGQKEVSPKINQKIKSGA